MKYPYDDETATWTIDSGFGDKTYRLGFAPTNHGFWVVVTNAESLDDALETVGAMVWDDTDEYIPRILRAEYDVVDDYDVVSYFPVNGGQHYIDMPTIAEEE